MKPENELIFVGYTNGTELLLAAENKGSMFSVADPNYYIPLYMLRQHAHRIETTSGGKVILEQIQKQHRKRK
jgi:hypothetical protein